MKKSILYMILWGSLLQVGTMCSIACQGIEGLRNGAFFNNSIIVYYKEILMLLFAPFVLIPLLGMACYHSIKEKIKVIKIVSICLLTHHALCVIIVLVQTLSNL